jgi:hypothetical protein
MYFNGKRERDRILHHELARGYDRFADMPRYCAYINLCIAPYNWEDVYTAIKSRASISLINWDCLNGVIMALLVSLHKKTEHTLPMIPEMSTDFVDYIRMDKGNSPWRFLLSMKRYLPRYFVMRSLAAVGIHWRDVAYDLMGARNKPAYTSYHSLFTNLHVRTLVKATSVFKHMRHTGDPDYQAGVNDKHSLLLKESSSTKCHKYEYLENVVDLYISCLPSWNPAIRAKVCYCISFLQPLHLLFEKQMLPSTSANVLGTKLP